MLKVDKVCTYYGKVMALHEVSFEIGQDEIVSIIGANGAGKSTLMKSIMGTVPIKSGSIQFEGKEISKQKPHVNVKNGIVYVPEGREIFPNLTVKENLEMGAFCRNYSSKKINELYEECYEMFPKLKERQKQQAGSLSGGEQQMLAIARGLMSEPKLIMFDEPSLGLAPVIVDEVFDIIVKLQQAKHIPVVLVEQNAFMALSISNRAYVLENGVVSLSGQSSELLNMPSVKEAYLGG
ncbi:MAG: ABC transporter ATP-binding protein [Lachnospiraceae bacterium]|nr:ABC transporter ATP-binding protein [Lachnospiraceae bacterium]